MDYISINRKLWNAKTASHYESEFYNVQSFIKGADSLKETEITLLGNVTGKKILHLQCHFGMDSISLSRRGAEVTGIDLSDESIKKANELAATAGTHTQFIQSDIYSLDEKINEQFDIVFTSYGVVGWLPDMDKWAKVIEKFLKPSGKFIMVEFHPVVWMFSDDFEKIEFSYVDPNHIVEEEEGTYADKKASLKNKSVSWNHGLATVLDALIKNGMNITDFQEFDFSPYNCFENTVETEPGKFQIKGLENKIPMIYSVVAEKR